MIDTTSINEVLVSSAREVFETMIFMDLEECFDSERHIEGDILLGSITFNGDFKGCLAICCNLSCAEAIAANMLGLDPNESVSQEDIYDAIGEVTNMIMGSIKTRIQQNVGNLNVSIPMVVSGHEIETNLGEGMAQKAFVKVSIDSEYITELKLLYKEEVN